MYGPLIDIWQPTSLVFVTKLKVNFFGLEELGNSKLSLDGLGLGVNMGGNKKCEESEDSRKDQF